MTGRKNSSIGSLLKLAAVGVCLLGLAVGLGALMVSKILVFVVEQAGHSQSVWLHPRFISFPTINIGPGPVTLMAFIFPGSKFDEELEIDWYEEPPARTQLTTLRSTATRPLATVADWYSNRLGKDFSKTEGWPDPHHSYQERWRSRVEKTADAAALVFEQSLGQRVRGVLLRTSPERVIYITLYDSQR
jgi:hypothetical protein